MSIFRISMPPLLLVICTIAISLSSAWAQSVPKPPVLHTAPHHVPLAAAPDYSDKATWLCLPGQSDHCDVDLDTTEVAADGTLTAKPFVGVATNPPIDCFYVYPTVSIDAGGNSDLVANEEEASVIRHQAARFRSVCRVFAPLYRQITLTALRARMNGGTVELDGAAAYNDVKSAWEHYLVNENNGRGVVLIGHSQGSGMLNRLIAAEIDGKPAQKLIVSAMLTGSNTAVPTGGIVGGAFQQLPLCTTKGEVGCVISYVTFRDDVPPPAHSRFGRVRGAETDTTQQAACVNPAMLDGSNGNLHAYLASGKSAFASSRVQGEWVVGAGAEPTTDFVSVPGLLTGNCVYENGFSYLSVTTHGDANDSRADSITGDVFVGEQRLDDWGLHLIDMNVVMGNLVNIVRLQGEVWSER
ncbi:MAG: DUF3089 domain-containing protein [Oceanicoccus sp.]